jgi:hypothetical protein
MFDLIDRGTHPGTEVAVMDNLCGLLATLAGVSVHLVLATLSSRRL